jgi:3-hydroxy-3-methylglutaryl CoA synthase
MIREMIDYYSERQLQPQFSEMVTKKEHKENLKLKLDFVFFNDYIKTQVQNEATNDKEFKNDERFFIIEQNIQKMITKEDLKS